MASEAGPRAAGGTVTFSVTVRTLSGGTVIDPLEGETPRTKDPPTVATHIRFAGAPLARRVIWIGCVVLGAKAALGRSTVSVRGGIHPVAALEEPADRSSKPRIRARMFLGTKRSGGRATPAPPLRTFRIRQRLLENRDADLLREAAGFDPGVVVTRGDAASRIVGAVPQRHVRSSLLRSIYQLPDQTSVHVEDGQLDRVLRALRQHVQELGDRIGRVRSGIHECESVSAHPPA